MKNVFLCSIGRKHLYSLHLTRICFWVVFGLSFVRIKHVLHRIEGEMMKWMVKKRIGDLE